MALAERSIGSRLAMSVLLAVRSVPPARGWGAGAGLVAGAAMVTGGIVAAGADVGAGVAAAAGADGG
jgi:hypothetical protein